MKRHLPSLLGSIFLISISSAFTWLITTGIKNNNITPQGPKELGQNVSSSDATISSSGRKRESSSGNGSKSVIFKPEINHLKLTEEGIKDRDFNHAIGVVEACGDFSALAVFFEGIRQTEREAFFIRIPNIFSKLGPKHDIAKKLALLEKMNVPSSTLETFKRKILEMEARERYGALRAEGVLATLKDEEFGSICRALATSRMKQGFQCIEDGASESAKRAAASMVTQFAIRAGTMEASKEISSLPPGIIRDEAVAEMVLWLRKTGSENEAAPWLETIQDEKAKARAMGK